MSANRETLGSRLGFLLLSAGCAIGLGNVWRFPFITGKYGGAVFLLFYLAFLVIMGLPVLIMEFSVGRASRLNMGKAFQKLEPQFPLCYGSDATAASHRVSTQWHDFGWFSLVGCSLLMMFYIPVAGWMLDYTYKGVSGKLIAPENVPGAVEVLNKVSSADVVSNSVPAVASAEVTEQASAAVVAATEVSSSNSVSTAAVSVAAEAMTSAAKPVEKTKDKAEIRKEYVAKYVGGLFDSLLASPGEMLFWALITSVIGFGVCALGVQKGVEKVTKFMMVGLLVIMIGLAIYALTLPGAKEGLKFYLKPDWSRAMNAGIWPLINDAMNQAFFTLSIGIGSMCIFGSYLNKERTLTSESAIIVGLDTFVALTAGLIIFPACFAYNVEPNAGPGLIFVTLPNVFNGMGHGTGWIFGALFFVFMATAALTTVIAVVENIIAYGMDSWGWSRKKSTLINFVAITALTVPCILGFNVWSKFSVPHIGGVLDCEDFLVSNTLLPIGALIYALFCCHWFGWGWDNFIAEADTGKGLKFPKCLRFYLTWILPVILAGILVIGYWQKFMS